jgi:hypothetical protein
MRGEVENRRVGRARDRGRARKRSREDIGGLGWGEGGKRSQTSNLLNGHVVCYIFLQVAFMKFNVADYVHRLLRLCFIRL